MRAATRFGLILSLPVSLGAQNATPTVDLEALADSVAATGTTLDGFNNSYGGRLTTLPSWSTWVEAVHSLSPHARAAFDGKENLHSYNDDIAKLKTTYDDLSREASAKGISIQSN